MRRGLALALGVAALALALVLGAGSLLRGALMLTSADPGALGLFASSSPKPATLALQARSLYLEPHEEPTGQSGRSRPVDERIAFTFPASYWSVIDLKDAPSGSQRLGIEVWSRSLDPVAPDRIRARTLCGNAPCPPEIDPFLSRRNAGEFAVRVEVTSVIGTEARRQRVLRGRSGLERTELDAHRPCAIGRDEAHDLITLSPPAGDPEAQACNFVGNGSRSRKGVVSRPRHFAKGNPDGSLRYIVLCNHYTEDLRGRGGSCQLQGYFGIWPLFMWVDADRIEEWDAVYTRVSDLLARHVAHRTDTPPQKDAAL